MTHSEQTFLLRIARLLVGKHGLVMQMERLSGRMWRIETGSPYGALAEMTVEIVGPSAANSESGRPLCLHDVVHGLRTQLRRMAHC